MADNVLLNGGAGGDTCAADDIGGIKHQRIKIEHGADGSATDVSSASPLPTRQNGATSTLSATAANAASVTVLASNGNRLRAWLYNDSASACYMKYGAAAAANSFTKRLLPGEFHPVEGYTGVIDAIWDAANGNMRATELTA